MFDVGFSELLLIAVIGLIVIGPKRLPETVRYLGLWTGRLKRALAHARRELEREVGMDDIRRQLHNEEVMRNLAEYEEETGHRADENTPASEPPSEKRNAGGETPSGAVENPDKP